MAEDKNKQHHSRRTFVLLAIAIMLLASLAWQERHTIKVYYHAAYNTGGFLMAKPLQEPRPTIDFKFVPHAGGEIKGQSHTNTPLRP